MLTDKLQEVTELHSSQGFLNYKETYCEYVNELQVHFYKTQIMHGIEKYNLRSVDRRWYENIDWRLLWTDKFVHCSQYDSGAFNYNGEYIKDMYYDLAKVCIPYVSELDIDDEISKNWHNNKYLTGFYKKKPGAMVYMIGAIENNNSDSFVTWYNLFTKNIEKINKL